MAALLCWLIVVHQHRHLPGDTDRRAGDKRAAAAPWPGLPELSPALPQPLCTHRTSLFPLALDLHNCPMLFYMLFLIVKYHLFQSLKFQMRMKPHHLNLSSFILTKHVNSNSLQGIFKASRSTLSSSVSFQGRINLQGI